MPRREVIRRKARQKVIKGKSEEIRLYQKQKPRNEKAKETVV